MAEKAVRITTFEAGLVAAMLNDQTKGGEWFGPGQPMATAGPEDVKGRQFDYMQSSNINYIPKRETTEKGLDFPTIRYLCNPAMGGLDLLRLAIETVKDKMSTQAWTIRVKDKKDGSQSAKDEAKLIMQALQRPDGIHSFRAWQRMVFEDPLSIDHNFIYKSPAPKWMKSPFKFIPEPIDGGLFKLLLDGDGRRPLPVEEAYQQILHGMVGAAYTPQELLYFPYNPLPQRAYAMGPVEQFVGIVNIALRRQLSVSQYYSEGNVPDALIGVPEDWKTAQIKEFQEYWDMLLEGNTAERRHAKFVPGGMTPHFTRDPKLKDDEDDYLSRIICFCYGLSSTALVKATNRAVAGTQHQEAQEEGLEPRKIWFKDVVDNIVSEVYEEPDFEFAYQDEEIQDPLVKAQVFQIALGGPTGAGKAWLTIDEVREKTGEPQMTPEQEEELKPPDPVPPVIGPDGKPLPPPIPGGSPGKPPVPGKTPAAPGKKPVPAAQGAAPKVQKLSKGAAKPASRRDRPAMLKQEAKVTKRVTTHLRKVAKAVIPDLVEAYGALAKASDDEPAKKVSKVVGDEAMQDLVDYLQDQGERVHTMGVQSAADELQDRAEDEMVHLANDQAIDWASDHAGELIKDLVDATQADIEKVVSQALEEGWSNDKLADQLHDSWSFSKARAELIATTETANADIAGNNALYREAGIEEVMWIVVESDACDDCQAMDGKTAPVGGEFEDGSPADEVCHPRGRCDRVAVVPDKKEGA